MYFKQKNFEAAKSWSLLDIRPVLVYIDECDDCIVFWNGFILSHKMALCLAMIPFKIFPTPEMREFLYEDHKKLYYTGAFQTNAWDSMVKGKRILKYLSGQMMIPIQESVKNHTLGEVVGWFSYDRAVKIT